MKSFAAKILTLAITSQLNNLKGSLLDFGCGDAPFYDYYKESVSSVTLSDLKKRVAINETFIESDGNYPLPFIKNEYDVILCTEVLEHVKNPQLLISEFYRISKKDGILILSTPFLYPIHESPDDYWRFTPFALTLLASNAGYRNFKIFQVGCLRAIIIDYFDKFLTKVIFRKSKKVSNTISSVLYRASRSKVRRFNSGETINGSHNSFALGYVMVCEK